ncbi:FliG C-terminal domain-containing protein [Fluviispira sanaruensis]|uniref:Flagellar motor switch protein FliG n=1 Tax=Fluviispira sanaruensis TaxID=2493639 RepID=A0A4P2VKD0_FLUSA|nr:FliG C-terminal domain-containing protein [Fluviispira sanaruensis]BBH53221.1 flagellar motor switch protein FliG [Fluviispira sanaruensis]
MTPEQKAAAILALAGEENASQLVQNIPKHEIKRIFRAFSRLPQMAGSDIDKIAKEFLEIIKKLNMEKHDFSIEKVKKILKSANSTLKDDNWFDSISDSFIVDDIRRFLEIIDNRSLSNWLKNELPQTMSLVLSICTPEKSSALFKLMPESIRSELILRISQMNHVDTLELENLHEELEKLNKNFKTVITSAGGFEKILAVLQASPVEQRQKLLEGITLKDPDLAQKLQFELISVAKISELDPKHLGVLCSSLSDKVLNLALRLESFDIKEKYLRAVSKKRRHLLEESLNEGKVSKKEAEESASLLVKKALSLKDEGKIVFPWEETLI